MLVKQSLVEQHQQNIITMRAQTVMQTPPMSVQRIPSKPQRRSYDGDEFSDRKRVKASMPTYTPSAKRTERHAPQESDEDSESDSPTETPSLQRPRPVKQTPAPSTRSPVKPARASKGGSNPFAKSTSNPFAKGSGSKAPAIPIEKLGRADDQSGKNPSLFSLICGKNCTDMVTRGIMRHCLLIQVPQRPPQSPP